MDVQEHLVKCGIMLRPLGPKPIQHTTAERPKEKVFGVAGGLQTSITQDAPQMLQSPEYPAASYLMRGYSFAGRNPVPSSERPMTNRKKEKTKRKRTQKRIGQYEAVPLPPPGHGVTRRGTSDAH